jgi:endo-1,4-beta-D-glucanase Y
VSCTVALACAATLATRDAELVAAWQEYVAAYVSEDGRVIDRGDSDRSTSEGQAYAMVRAVWIDDRGTFERVRAWTDTNLRSVEGPLPAWLWGRRADGTWGTLDPAPAADSDQWIAWALLAGAERWREPAYAAQALVVLAAIWERETRVVAGTRYVVPGPWAQTGDPVRLNPSYWLPFAWRDFARADPSRPWSELLEGAYRGFAACRGATGLARDWCYLREADGTVVAAPRGSEAHDDHGFEALRVPWTLALEAAWHDEPRARRLLAPYARLARDWAAGGMLPAVVAPSGEARVGWAHLGRYGALLPAWKPADARALWERALAPARAPHGWGPREDYYLQNWVWLGRALQGAPRRPRTDGGSP